MKIVPVEMETCPTCEREWPYVSEQGAAIGLTGQCIVCNELAPDGSWRLDVVELSTRLDENGTIAERHIRETQAGYTVEPCPSCLKGQYLKGWDFHACPECGGTKHIGYALEDDGGKVSAHRADE